MRSTSRLVRWMLQRLHSTLIVELPMPLDPLLRARWNKSLSVIVATLLRRRGVVDREAIDTTTTTMMMSIMMRTMMDRMALIRRDRAPRYDKSLDGLITRFDASSTMSRFISYVVGVWRRMLVLHTSGSDLICNRARSIDWHRSRSIDRQGNVLLRYHHGGAMAIIHVKGAVVASADAQWLPQEFVVRNQRHSCKLASMISHR